MSQPIDLTVVGALVIIALRVSFGYWRVKADRKSGRTQSFGHPFLDQFLLFPSGLLMAGLLAASYFLLP